MSRADTIGWSLPQSQMGPPVGGFFVSPGSSREEIETFESLASILEEMGISTESDVSKDIEAIVRRLMEVDTMYKYETYFKSYPPSREDCMVFFRANYTNSATSMALSLSDAEVLKEVLKQMKEGVPMKYYRTQSPRLDIFVAS